MKPSTPYQDFRGPSTDNAQYDHSSPYSKRISNNNAEYNEGFQSPYHRGQKNLDFANPSLVSNEIFYPTPRSSNSDFSERGGSTAVARRQERVTPSGSMRVNTDQRSPRVIIHKEAPNQPNTPVSGSRRRIPTEGMQEKSPSDFDANSERFVFPTRSPLNKDQRILPKDLDRNSGGNMSKAQERFGPNNQVNREVLGDSQRSATQQGPKPFAELKTLSEAKPFAEQSRSNASTSEKPPARDPGYSFGKLGTGKGKIDDFVGESLNETVKKKKSDNDEPYDFRKDSPNYWNLFTEKKSELSSSSYRENFKDHFTPKRSVTPPPNFSKSPRNQCINL
jgi:hypothetical protein